MDGAILRIPGILEWGRAGSGVEVAASTPDRPPEGGGMMQVRQNPKIRRVARLSNWDGVTMAMALGVGIALSTPCHVSGTTPVAQPPEVRWVWDVEGFSQAVPVKGTGRWELLQNELGLNPSVMNALAVFRDLDADITTKTMSRGTHSNPGAHDQEVARLRSNRSGRGHPSDQRILGATGPSPAMALRTVP